MSNKERIISIDFAKSIAIFGVVFIHAKNNDIYSNIVSEIFRVSVPIFIVFFIYFLEKSLTKYHSLREQYRFIAKIFKRLFLPYFFFSVLYMVLFYQNINIDKIFTSYLSGYGWSGQYFFILLFQLLVIYPLFRQMHYWNIGLILLSSILFYFLVDYFLWDLSIVAKISDRLFIYWLPYVFLGNYLFTKLIKLEPSFHKSYLYVIFLIPFEYFILDQANPQHGPYILSTILLATFAISIYILLYKQIYENIIHSKIKIVLNYISQRTLGIFVLNPLVIFYLKPIINLHSTNELISVFFSFFLALVVLITSLFIIFILSKTPIRVMVHN